MKQCLDFDSLARLASTCRLLRDESLRLSARCRYTGGRLPVVSLNPPIVPTQEQQQLWSRPPVRGRRGHDRDRRHWIAQQRLFSPLGRAHPVALSTCPGRDLTLRWILRTLSSLSD